jgi:hypothetical protein
MKAGTDVIKKKIDICKRIVGKKNNPGKSFYIFRQRN